MSLQVVICFPTFRGDLVVSYSRVEPRYDTVSCPSRTGLYMSSVYSLMHASFLPRKLHREGEPARQSWYIPAVLQKSHGIYQPSCRNRMINTIKFHETMQSNEAARRLRLSRGSVLAFGTQVREFKPDRSRWSFQGEKKKSSARLPSEGK